MAGSTFNVEIVGLKKLRRAFEESPEITEPILQKAIARSGAYLGSHTDASTVPWVTGTLARSFQPIDIGKLFAKWYPRVEYAKAVQFGMPSSPGRYVPAIGKRLVNGANIGTHPGFPGRNYMEKILEASKSEIDNTFRAALKEMTDALANS